MRLLTCVVLLALVGAMGCDNRRAARLRGDFDQTRITAEAERAAPVTIVEEPQAVRVLDNVRFEDVDDPYTVYYDPNNVVTVRGAITGLYRFPMSGDRTGLMARLHVDGNQPFVYLGPENWLFEQDFHPNITNVIAAKGTMHLGADNRSILIAREAVLHDVTLAIRDMDGRPLYPVPVRAKPVD